MMFGVRRKRKHLGQALEGWEFCLQPRCLRNPWGSSSGAEERGPLSSPHLPSPWEKGGPGGFFSCLPIL